MASYEATDQQVINNPTQYKGTDRIIQPCGRCEGTGSVWWGIDVTGAVRDTSGKTRIVPRVCFQCNGTKQYVVLVKTIRARHARELKLLAEQERQEQIAQQARLARAEWNATHPELVERLTAISESTAYELRTVRESAADLLNLVAIPDESAIAAIFQVVDEYAAREASRADAPTGRQTVTVTIRGFKDQHTQWGVTCKMLVEHGSGWKGFGSVPSGMEAERGDEVTLTATFAPKADDPSFAIFKMPRIAK